MSNITAVKSQNDGRQWFNVTFTDDVFGVEAGSYEYGVAADGTLIDDEGFPVDGNEYERAAVLRAIDAASQERQEG